MATPIKTISVFLKDGSERVINERDFDKKVHTIEKPKAKKEVEENSEAENKKEETESSKK